MRKTLARELRERALVFAVLQDEDWMSVERVARQAGLATEDAIISLKGLLGVGRVERSRLGTNPAYCWRRRVIERTPPSRYEDR